MSTPASFKRRERHAVGPRRTDRWISNLSPPNPSARPLTGWAGSGDTRDQVSLGFPTLDAAKAYAAKHDLAATVIPRTGTRAQATDLRRQFR